MLTTTARTGLFILLCAVSSFLFVAALYPSLLIFHQESYMYGHDTEIPFENTFTIVSQFYHGGLQLWDRFGQMNIAYYHLSSGVYTLANCFTAFLYILLAPMFSHPSEAFHSVYTVGFHGFTIFIRTVGGYLLLRRLGLGPTAIFLSVIHLNTFLSVQAYSGLLTNNLYSYLPLAMYFLLCFFENFRLHQFLLVLLALTITVANSVLIALGYFYVVVHFFIVSCIIWRIIFKKSWPPLRLFRGKWKAGLNRKNILKFLGITGICFMIMLPNLYLAQSLQKDFFIDNSGLGGTTGRMQEAFNIAKYFTRGITYIDPKTFLIRSIDYLDQAVGEGWMFMGIGTLLLSLLGLVFTKDSRKHIFFWSILFIIFLNADTNPSAVTSAVHWINVLTNPFQFLLRSLHMPAVLMPYLFFPLIGLGWEAVRSLSAGKTESVYLKRLPVMLMLLIPVIFVPARLRMYAASTSLLLLIFFYCFGRKKEPVGALTTRGRKTLAFGIFLIFLFIDFKALAIVLDHPWRFKGKIAPAHYKGLEGPVPFVADYQNPRILPFPEYYRLARPVEPVIFSDQNSYGLFYHFTSLDRNFRIPNAYEPRHISYKGLYKDVYIRPYLLRDKRLLFFAGQAIPAFDLENSKMAEVLGTRKVIMVDLVAMDLKRAVEQIRSLKGARESGMPPLPKWTWDFSFEQARRRTAGEDVEYSFDLPADFPSYLATNVFTDDRHRFSLRLGARQLWATQGKIIGPFAFDVQNMRSHKLVLSLPADWDVRHQTLSLEAKPFVGISDIWRNEFDNLGFNYQAPDDGWLVFNYPYDKKWRLTMDGQPVQLFKVNRYFLGTPVNRGEHQLLLQYWPDTPLRVMMGVSIIFTVVAFGGLCFLGIRQESLQDATARGYS